MPSMTRRAALTAACGAALPDTAASAAKRPNLIYVFADQLAYHHCGFAGNEHARTPNIDRLAGEGCNFSDAISNSPVCAPYRASLMTGKHQSSTGMVINELRLSPEHECFGHVLTRHGYRTGYIGKWHLWASEWGNHHLVRNGYVPPGPYRLGFDGQWQAYNFSHDYYGAPYFENAPEKKTWPGYEPDSQTDNAIAFLRAHAGAQEPFALFLSWGPPHSPWRWKNVPEADAEPYRAMNIPLRPNFSSRQDPYGDGWAKLPANPERTIAEELRVYYAQTASVDRNLGRLLRALDESGAAQDTILVFTSDHGEMFGSHGRYGKYIFYEEAARVPLMIRWPAAVRPGTKTGALAGTPDLMPTLLSLLGLPVPRGVEGADLSAQVKGRSGGPREQYLQCMGSTAAWADGTEWRAVRDREYTYAIYRRDGSELLFHNARDPFQQNNLAGNRAQAARLRHYREMSAKWRREHNDTFESCTWYRDRWTRERNIVQTAMGVRHDLQQLDRIVKSYLPEGIPAPAR